jgi:tetratricopeptide (TPR) repeat protein
MMPPTSDAAFDLAQLHAQGVAQARAGSFGEAMATFERILAVDPDHGEALNAAGVLTFQAGDKVRARALLERALQRLPGDAAPYFNLGWVQLSLGQASEALASCDAGLTLWPDIPGLHSNRGWALLELGRAAEALESCDAAIRLNPSLGNAHANRAWALLQLGRDAEALASCDAAVALDPAMPAAFSNRAWALIRLGRYAEAIENSDRALALEPNLAPTHTNRGVALMELRQFDEALKSFDRALALTPGSADAHFNRSLALNGLKRSAEALAESGHALALRPGFAPAHSSRGRSFHDLGRYDEALDCYAKAIAIDPNLGVVHYNMATTLLALLRLDAAWACYRRTLELMPDDADAHTDWAMAQLLTGDFQAGLREYEWRWKTVAAQARRRDLGRPLWLGDADIAGRTILLVAEQGYGDMIQFCRYARLVAALGARVILEVPPPLASLLAGLQEVSEIIVQGAPLPDFDFYCPLMSLPLAFATDVGSIPAETRYLAANPARVAAWRARLGPASGPRVGLVWSGSTIHLNDRNRSLALATLADALPSGPDYVCLQKELREADRPALVARPDIRFLGDDIVDFGDTAALCELVDVVVTVDTSVVHLAGALGRSVTLLLPFCPDWRWLLDRADSPWYPGMWLLRQPAPGDWSKPLADVSAALVELSASR